MEVDGVSYYEAGEAPEVCWLATEDGAAYAEADKPLDRLTDLLSEDAKYATIYERILGLTAQESGASMPTINEAVDNDELLKSPRLYAPHFIDKLEKCDAVEWRDKSWAHYRGRPCGTAHRGRPRSGPSRARARGAGR